MKRICGLSLLEVVVGMALLAIGALFVLGILPTGISSVKRSEDIEAATAYGLELIEEARQNLPPAVPQNYTLTLNQTEFSLRREIIQVDEYLTDVLVTARWNPTIPELRLVTRVHGQPPSPSPGPSP